MIFNSMDEISQFKVGFSEVARGICSWLDIIGFSEEPCCVGKVFEDKFDGSSIVEVVFCLSSENLCRLL